MRTKKWIVTSTKMQNTIVVSVHTYKSHPKYKKRFRVTKKFYAHDEAWKVNEWDFVTIKEIKPLSKLKRWTLVDKSES